VNQRRGEVWLADFGNPIGREQAGRRPAVVVSANDFNDQGSGVVIVVPTTSTRRGLGTHVEIEPGESGLLHTSYAKCEDVKSISEERLMNRLGAVGAETSFAIGRVLRFLLDT
jgi:mRNA interferase MazF